MRSRCQNCGVFVSSKDVEMGLQCSKCGITLGDVAQVVESSKCACKSACRGSKVIGSLINSYYETYLDIGKGISDTLDALAYKVTSLVNLLSVDTKNFDISPAPVLNDKETKSNLINVVRKYCNEVNALCDTLAIGLNSILSSVGVEPEKTSKENEGHITLFLASLNLSRVLLSIESNIKSERESKNSGLMGDLEYKLRDIELHLKDTLEILKIHI